MKQYTLTGQVRPKKNAKQIFRTSVGRTVIVPSNRFTVWNTDAQIQIRQQGITRFNGAVSINVEFTVGDKRKFDMSNSFESIADLLVDCGVIIDDNYSILQDIHLRYAGYAKGVWKTKVVLREIECVV